MTETTEHPQPIDPSVVQWHKNGDHPFDGVGEMVEDPMGGPSYERQEGKVVRFFRHPDVPGTDVHERCGQTWHVHGWLDNGGDGENVCPGDWITLDDNGYHARHHKPYVFDREEDGSLSLHSAVHQAIGTASVCWENGGSGGGVFDDALARDVAAALLAEIEVQRPQGEFMWQVTTRLGPDGMESPPAVQIEVGKEMRTVLGLPPGVELDDQALMHAIGRAMIRLGTSVLGSQWTDDGWVDDEEDQG